MHIKTLILPALVMATIVAAPAIAGQTIVMPNGASIQYEGTAAPVFYSNPGPETPFFDVYDSGLDAYFHYDSNGQWLGVSGPGAANVPNVPTIPSDVVLPPSAANATGMTLPYTGQGIPVVYTDAQGNYTIIDAAAHTAQVLDSQGVYQGSGSWGAGTITTGSSGFGTSGGATSTTSGGSSSSFGGTSGGTTTTGGTTSGGVTSSGCVSNCGTTTGGGTDVPAPAALGLFGIAASGLALARRRRRKVS